MTHCRLATEMCRACWAEGRATLTMEASTTIINWAMAMTTRARHRCGSASWVVGGEGTASGSAVSMVIGDAPWGVGGRRV